MTKDIFALVDCNSFYCSCERLFNPKLKNKPVVVLSNNDGCIVARTDEAKALGIKMGEPYFNIKEFLKRNGVFVFSSNYALYGDISRRVMYNLSEFTPKMEIYSIDEAFLSLGDMKNQNLFEFGTMIKNEIYQNIGIPVGVGIGPTKVLAKICNYWAKKNKKVTGGVFDYSLVKNKDHFLKGIPVEEIWGIGRKNSEKLKTIGIRSALDLKNSNEVMIQKMMSITGRRIVEELREISCISLELTSKDKKQIISSRSFGKPIYNLDGLKESIANHVTTAGEKLRRQDCITMTILVFVQTNPFKNTPQYYNSATMNLISGSSNTLTLIKNAFVSLESIFKEGYEYKKAGVILMDIRKKSETQMDLFGKYDTEKQDKLMETLDYINTLDGNNSVKSAACGTDQFWKMMSEMKSKRFTTSWNCLLKIGS